MRKLASISFLYRYRVKQQWTYVFFETLHLASEVLEHFAPGSEVFLIIKVVERVLAVGGQLFEFLAVGFVLAQLAVFYHIQIENSQLL